MSACVRWLLLVAALAGSAAAETTERRLARLAAEKRSLAPLVDGDAGFVIRDREGTRRICGAEVPLFVEAVDRTLEILVTQGDRVRCAPAKGRIDCTVMPKDAPDDASPRFRLAFAAGPAGPRLLAALWAYDATPATVDRMLKRSPVACPVAAPATPASVPPGPPAPAETPAAPLPAAATRKLISDLVAGRASFASLVDPARGVVLIEHTESESDPPERKRSQHLCGAAAVRALETKRHWYQQILSSDEIFTCRNQLPPPECVIGQFGEFSAKERLQFRPTPRGLVLDTVVMLNSSYPPVDQESVVARLRARQLAKRCEP